MSIPNFKIYGTFLWHHYFLVANCIYLALFPCKLKTRKKKLSKISHFSITSSEWLFRNSMWFGLWHSKLLNHNTFYSNTNKTFSFKTENHLCILPGDQILRAYTVICCRNNKLSNRRLYLSHSIPLILFSNICLIFLVSSLRSHPHSRTCMYTQTKNIYLEKHTVLSVNTHNKNKWKNNQ